MSCTSLFHEILGKNGRASIELPTWRCPRGISREYHHDIEQAASESARLPAEIWEVVIATRLRGLERKDSHSSAIRKSSPISSRTIPLQIS
jgi:hypothetical protein